MAITLDNITLPDDLLWSDQYDWTPVKQHTQLGLNGTPIIQESVLLGAGLRPVTLLGGERAAWVPKFTVDALHSTTLTPGQTMSLDYHGTLMTVMWLRSKRPIEATQVMRTSNPTPGVLYFITLKLVAV